MDPSRTTRCPARGAGTHRSGFDSALQAATRNCPMSRALQGNVEIRVTGTYAEAG